MIDSPGAGDLLLADRVHDSDALRVEVEERGVFANVRFMPQRVDKPTLSASLYKLRSAVNRLFGKIKHDRAIATRDEKHPENYLALIKLAAARIWMKFKTRMRWKALYSSGLSE